MVTGPAERIYYDGECGLCHRWVLFTLARERGRELFRFAPLAGPTFATDLTPAERGELPDSLAVRTADGRLLTRSAGALHVFARLGGGWAALARVLGLVPRPLRDLAYDGLARVRKRLFARPVGACPLVPQELARRFDP
jgi:predicted DCC family thiol-disulfide oxidoreductase YuxK